MPATDQTTSSISSTDSVLLERLEYGKLCLTPDGPVVDRTMEHRWLGQTRDFPPELRPLCAPAVIGVSASEHDELPRQCPHGTVLRPAGLRGGAVPVLARVRTRPENGEGMESRHYTLARYLVAPRDGGIEPLSLFEAMGPLRGMTEDEAGALRPIAVAPVSALFQRRLASEEARRQARSFAREALIYVMSGVPVGIADRIAEEDFFALVTALWRLLPSRLRPYLSAGWGVSASLSGKLAVTYARQQADLCASFSRGTDGKWKWAPPREARSHGKREREPFQREHVTAGAHYVSYVFGCEPYSLPKIADFNEQSRAGELSEGRLPDGYDTLIKPLDFDDPAVAGLFIAPGLDARDRRLIGEWKQHLAVRADDGGDELAEPASDFAFSEGRREAFNLAREALSDDGRRAQADALLWRLVASGDPALSLEMQGGFGAARLRLFGAIGGGDPRELLEALRHAAAAGEAYRLPGGAREAMGRCLKSNLGELDTQCARLHGLLLREPPPDYLDWVEQHAFEIALAAMGLADEWAEALYQRIKSMADSRGVRTLLNWERGVEPEPEDEETFRNLDAEARHQSFDRLSIRWAEQGNDSAARRERLLPWLRLAWDGQAISDPLLALVFEKEPGADDLERLAAADRLREAPPSLSPQVARLVLRNSPRLLPRIRQDAEKWSPALRYWPADVSAALFPGSDFEAEVSTASGSERVWLAEGDEEAYVEAGRLKFRAEELEQLIRSSPQPHPSVLRWYWRWAKDCATTHPNPRTPIVQVCKYILGLGAPPDGPDLECSDIARARQLAEAEADSLPELKSKAEDAWRETDDEIAKLPEKLSELREKKIPEADRKTYLENAYKRIGGQMLVLLVFHPEVDFIPSARQLELLLNYRDVVKEHLNNKAAMHPNRFARFRLVTARPMELDYPGAGHAAWKDEYAACRFWIVFRGLPVKKQRKGTLGAALDFYAGTAPRVSGSEWEKHLAGCAEVCQTYLNSYHGSELREALKRVLSEFVIRWLHRYERRSESEIHSILIDAPITSDSPFWELVKTIRRFGENKVVSRAVDDYFWENLR
jgi:hypothetical protein